jgi:hypothetical protein
MTDADGPLDSSLRDLLGWYRGLGAHPTWHGDLVQQLRPWLGSLVMVQFRDGEDSPVISVYGTTLSDSIGRDLTGRRFSDVDQEFRPLTEIYRQVNDQNRVYWSIIQVRYENGRSWHYQRLLLPLADGKGGRVLGCMKQIQRLEPWHISGAPTFVTVAESFLD